MESLSTEDDTLLKCLIDLAEHTPKYLRHQLDIVFNLCLKVGLFLIMFTENFTIYDSAGDDDLLICVSLYAPSLIMYLVYLCMCCT